MATTFTVLQVAEHIDRQVREVWSSQFWVRGEVAGLKIAASGTVYFDLVQTGGNGGIIALLPVSMPASKARLVHRRLKAVGQPLANGLEIRIKANLSFWVRGGRLSLALSDIDPAHTAGAIALARRALLEQMEADGSRWANASLSAARVPLALGLITSPGSQAFHDLTEELRASGYPFQIRLCGTLVQGPEAPGQIVRALQRLDGLAVDVILLTRGGGAEVDLMTFDSPEVARAVAACATPVWTGIGHHLDSPVAEQVAAAGFKTPTALAQAIVAAVMAAAKDAEQAWSGICAHARRRLVRADQDLAMAARRTSAARLALRAADGRLEAHERRLSGAATRALLSRSDAASQRERRLGELSRGAATRSGRRLDRAQRLVDLADPQRLIARGWSLTTDDQGMLVTGPLPTGSTIHTRTRGGSITSTVTGQQDRGTDG